MKKKETDHKLIRLLIRKFAKEYHLHKNPPVKPSKGMAILRGLEETKL